jgi:hypothetical protein
MEADIAGFIMVGLVTAFVAGQIFRTLRTYAAQKTLREAIMRGVTVTPEMLVEAEKTAEPGANDLRYGMVLIALALAIAGFGLIQGSNDAIKGAAGIALFPLFVGIALLLRVRMQQMKGDA